MQSNQILEPELSGGSFSNAPAELTRIQRIKRSIGLASRVLVAGSCMYGGGLIGIAAGNYTNPVEISAGPFTADITMEPAISPDGGSSINTPVGSASYPATHDGASIVAAPMLNRNVNSADLLTDGSDLELVVETTQEELRSQLEDVAIRTARNTTLYNLAGNATGLMAYAGAMSFMERHRSTKDIQMPRKFMALGILAVCSISALPYSVQPYITRNAAYSQNVEFSGLIAEAQKYAYNYEDLSRQLRDPAAQFYALNRAVEGLNSEEPFEVKPRLCIYFASDAHGGGYRIVNELYQYDAEADCVKVTVIKGDSVDWGLEFENSRDAIRLLPTLPKPVLVVKGNHDSRNLMNYIRSFNGINDIGEQQYEVAGIRIIGITDPTFTPDSDANREIDNDTAYQAGVRAGAAYRASDVPAIIVAHRPNMLEGFLSELSAEDKQSIILVAAGHTHQLEVVDNFADSGIPYLNAGTVSGAGFRLFDPETGNETPLSAATAYIAEDSDGDLQLQRVGQLVQNFTGSNSTYSLWTPSTAGDDDAAGTPTTMPE